MVHNTLVPKTGRLYGKVAELLPGLYFASFERPPTSDEDVRYINIDDRVYYQPFYTDFGPLNLSVVFRFCDFLNNLISAKSRRKICCFTNSNDENRVNGAFITASYIMIYHGVSADTAYLKLEAAQGPEFVGFRDAALGAPTYLLHIHDVLRSVEKAIELGWLDFDTFDPEEYEYYERVENGDFNWIIPGKFLSFCGPHAKTVIENGYPYHAPEVYFDYFREHNISTIVRLNSKLYEASRFTNAGFQHVDLFFMDGSTPSDEIVQKFIKIVDDAPGGVAVHCQAGLGRTGTLIACWMMKEYGLTAAECMGWLRICRPGSVIGPQQDFLVRKQKFCWSMANNNLIVQLPARRARRKDSEMSEGKGVSKLVSKVDEIRLGSASSSHVNGNANAGQNKRTRPNILPVRSAKSAANNTNGQNGKFVDETAIDDRGRSQGDRLLAQKVLHQHDEKSVKEKKVSETTKQKAEEKQLNSKVAKQKVTFCSNASNGSPEPVLPRHEAVARLTSITRYSSPTTPIKPMSATPSPSYNGHHRARARLVAKNLLVSSALPSNTPTAAPVPIRRVTVRCGPKAIASKSVSSLHNGIRSRPYPSSGTKIEMPPTTYSLRPRRSHSPTSNYAMLAAQSLPPNTQALIGRARAAKEKHASLLARSTASSRLYSYN